MCSKKSLLLTCQFLALLVNTLATKGKYPVLNRDNLTPPNQMQLSGKKKTLFLNFLLDFLNLDYIVNIMQNRMTLTTFPFPKLRTLKTWLDKCLKIPFSEDPSTRNMVNVAKHCWNLHHISFIIFIDHWQGNWFGKSLSYWHAIFLGLFVNIGYQWKGSCS